MWWRKILLLLIIPLAMPQLPANPPPSYEEQSLLEKVAYYEHILSDDHLLRTLPAEEIIGAFDSLSTLIHKGTLYTDPAVEEELAAEEFEAKRALSDYLHNRPPIPKQIKANGENASLRTLAFYNNKPYQAQTCGGFTYSCKKVWKWICRHKKAIIIGVVVVIVVVLGFYLISSAVGAAAAKEAAAAAAAGGGTVAAADSSTKKKDPKPKKPITPEKIALNFDKYTQKSQKTVTYQLTQKLQSLPDKKPESVQKAILEFSKEFASDIAHEVGNYALDMGETIAIPVDFVKETLHRAIPASVKNIAKVAMPMLTPEEKGAYKTLVADSRKKVHKAIDTFFKTDLASNYTEKKPNSPFTPQIGELPPPGSMKAPRLRKSIGKFQKANKFLKPYRNRFIPETQARYLIEKTGTPTFPRPKGIPSNYRVKISGRGVGMKYVHPNNTGTYIRVMPGKPHSPYKCQQKPYIKQQINGQSVDKFGRPVPTNSPEAHMPIDEFQYKKRP